MFKKMIFIAIFMCLLVYLRRTCIKLGTNMNFLWKTCISEEKYNLLSNFVITSLYKDGWIRSVRRTSSFLVAHFRPFLYVEPTRNIANNSTAVNT